MAFPFYTGKTKKNSNMTFRVTCSPENSGYFCRKKEK